MRTGVSEQYTADIRKKVNGYVAAFGKERGYSFIFGACSLTYANDTYNATIDVIKFINERHRTETGAP